MTKFIKTVEALAGVALVSIYAVIFVKVIAGMITKKFDPWLGIEDFLSPLFSFSASIINPCLSL